MTTCAVIHRSGSRQVRVTVSYLSVALRMTAYGTGTAPWVQPNATNRTSFGNHAWVEVTLSAATGPRVIDTCHALQAAVPTPPTATYSRAQYLAATLDGSHPHGNAITLQGGNGGNCCLSLLLYATI